MPPNNINTTSSLQNQNAMTYGYGQSTVMGNMMRTANATREDFNIEDLHCQIIFKVQRSKKLLKEIESLPNEREIEYLMMEGGDNASEFGSGRLPTKYMSNFN